MLNRFALPGYQEIYRHDSRRGVWLRVVLGAATMAPTRVELCAGREGDDHYVKLEAGQTLTPEMLFGLAEVVAYARDALASFCPPLGICCECGKNFSDEGHVKP